MVAQRQDPRPEEQSRSRIGGFRRTPADGSSRRFIQQYLAFNARRSDMVAEYPHRRAVQQGHAGAGRSRGRASHGPSRRLLKQPVAFDLRWRALVDQRAHQEPGEQRRAGVSGVWRAFAARPSWQLVRSVVALDIRRYVAAKCADRETVQFGRSRALRISRSVGHGARRKRLDGFVAQRAHAVNGRRYSNSATRRTRGAGCDAIAPRRAILCSKPARCPRSDRTVVRCRSTAGPSSRRRLFLANVMLAGRLASDSVPRRTHASLKIAAFHRRADAEVFFLSATDVAGCAVASHVRCWG